MTAAPSNPYIVDGVPALRPSLFCFLDILGYQDYVAQAQSVEDQSQLLTRLNAALRSGAEVLTGEDIRKSFDDLTDSDEPTIFRLVPKDHEITAFTDHIAIGWPIRGDGESDWGWAVSRIAQFQLEMVLAGFFVRGAVSVGPAYIDELSVFGAALLEAYKGESLLARDPRIVLTESAKSLVQKHMGYYLGWSPQQGELLVDPDGQWFIDYLQALILDEEYGAIGTAELAQHRDMVTAKLSLHKSEPKVWSKYEWAARYHNHFC